MKKKWRWIVGMLVVIGIAWPFVREIIAENRVRRLLQDESSENLTEIRFIGQQREAICANPKAIAYLNDAARRSQLNCQSARQLSYTAKISVGGFTTRHVILSVASDHSEICFGVPRHIFGEYDYWAVPIGKDNPKELETLINFLTGSINQAENYDDRVP
jgi:hypothetical protein